MVVVFFFQTLVKQKLFDWANHDHRDLLIAMLMTAADLSAIARPWDIQRRVAKVIASTHLYQCLGLTRAWQHVYAEFFEQGDKEVDILGKTTQDMFNRSLASRLPKMQVGNKCLFSLVFFLFLFLFFFFRVFQAKIARV